MALASAYFPDAQDDEVGAMVEKLLGRGIQEDKYHRDFLHDVMNHMSGCKDAEVFKAEQLT